MTASRAAPAPTHRPSPRAVVLAILGVALLVLLAVGAMQYATPQDDAARGIASFAVPPVGQPQLVEAFGEAIWLVQQPDGSVDAFRAKSPHLGEAIRYLPAAGVGRERWDANGRGTFQAANPGESMFLEDGRRVFGPAPRGLDRFRSHVTRSGATASVAVNITQLEPGNP